MALSLHFLSSGAQLVKGGLWASLEWNLNYLKAIIQDCKILEVHTELCFGVGGEAPASPAGLVHSDTSSNLCLR